MESREEEQEIAALTLVRELAEQSATVYDTDDWEFHVDKFRAFIERARRIVHAPNRMKRMS